MTSFPRRVTFDSNAWEKVFAPDDERYTPVRSALVAGRIEGRICDAGFRIEAIAKRHRSKYFSQPLMGVTTEIIQMNSNGLFKMSMSIGPDDSKHPGLPLAQAKKLSFALASGFKVMRGLAWLGLPCPPDLRDQSIFVAETENHSLARQERQLYAAFQIDQRGVGRGAFMAVAGWEVRDRNPAEQKQLSKACAEWADGELVAAHIGYQNDVLCTDDLARGAGKSVFDAENRQWLSAHFGVVFSSLDTLMLKFLS